MACDALNRTRRADSVKAKTRSNAKGYKRVLYGGAGVPVSNPPPRLSFAVLRDGVFLGWRACHLDAYREPMKSLSDGMWLKRAADRG
ncbi:hypothetical protein CUJ84_Chr003571 [Rhizobium leguminosarum]|uniref:Uncharacterized protein n=1 Tax=Rhizobium leguminosarum TaxID=384 RepID=A0A2K9Z6Q1_RHILE|nr:hypothetical protein CUJ84_Chr003571 [Rhizobium leguminosarum]